MKQTEYLVRISIVTLVSFFFFSSGLSAETADGDVWLEATEGVMKLYSGMASLIKAVILIGGLVVLGEIVIKLMSGDKESAKKLLWWLIGLAIGFALIEILSEASFV